MNDKEHPPEHSPDINSVKIPFNVAFSPKVKNGYVRIIMAALKRQYRNTAFVSVELKDDWVEQANLFFYGNDEEDCLNTWKNHFNKKENLFASRQMSAIKLDKIQKIKLPLALRRHHYSAKKRFVSEQILDVLFEKNPTVKNRGLLRTLELIDLFNSQVENEKKREWYKCLAPYPRGNNADQRFIDRIESNDELKNLSAENPLSLYALRFRIADKYCSCIQKKYKRELFWLFVLSLVVGLFSQIYGGISHFYANLPFTIGGLHFSLIELTLPLYVLFFGGLLVYYFWCVQRNNNDDKFVEFRLFAEALRVQSYWILAGVKENVAKFVLPINIAQVEGASIALHNWRKKGDTSSLNDIEAVKIGWIEGQIEYYRDAVQKREKKKKLCQIIGLFFYVSSLLLALIYCIVTLREKMCGLQEITYDLLPGFPWSLSDGMWLGLGPFIFAMIGYLIEKKGWEEEIESFKQSKKMFETINIELEKQETDHNALLLVLGREALKEHESWLKLHRNRKPEPNY